MIKAFAVEGNWVTINGTHVLIGANGKISKGPAKFIGSTVEDMKNVGKSAADRKAELKSKAKVSDKEGSSISEKSKEKKSKKGEKLYHWTTGEKFTYSTEGNNLVVRNANGDVVGGARLTNPKYAYDTAMEIVQPKDMLRKFEAVSKPAPVKTGNPTFDSAVNGSTAKKYPSGIDTPAQKRVYTKAVNSGMSSSDATKVAKNAGTKKASYTLADAIKSEPIRFYSDGITILYTFPDGSTKKVKRGTRR